MLKRFAFKALLIAIFLGTLYMGGKIAYAAYQRYTLELKINELKAQIAELEDRNKDVTALLRQLGASDYLLLKAKEAFNLKDANEDVAIISPDKTKSEDRKEDTQRNWRKWWELFFGSH